MLNPGNLWLDAAYMSYAFPEYFRQQPHNPQFAKGKYPIFYIFFVLIFYNQYRLVSVANIPTIREKEAKKNPIKFHSLSDGKKNSLEQKVTYITITARKNNNEMTQ